MSRALLESLADELDAKRAHTDACLAAIASIGGDPATVGELVAALRALAVACLGLSEQQAMPCDAWQPAYDAARAVLAKLPENSNEG